MDLSRVSRRERLAICRMYFVCGFVGLPSFWLINSVWFLSEAVGFPDSLYRRRIRRYVVASFLGFQMHFAVLTVWCFFYQTNRESWGEFGDAISFLVPKEMVAYTKDEEDYLFDIWKSVRKQDEDRGILNSSSNRQRYLKIYEAYKNQGYSRTYAQVETKLKKHRSSFIKTFNGGACTELNPTGCPRYQDLLDMFAELYRGSPYVANPIKVKEEPFSYLNLNGDSNIVFDPSELQEEGNNNGFLKELESIPLKNNSLDHSLDCNDGRMPRKLSYVNNLLPCKQACDRYTLGSPLPASHQQQTASQVHLPHQNQQLLKQQQRHQREIASTLQQIRDGNREHSRVLNQGLQMLAAAITKLVDSKLQISTGCVASPATSSPGAPPLQKKLSSADAELRDDDVDKCAFVDHAMIDRHDNDVHVPLVDNAQCDEDDDPMPLVGVGQCDDDEIDDEIDDVNN